MHNPAAFPTHDNTCTEGMSLRDYFAAAALTGLLSDSAGTRREHGSDYTESTGLLAGIAYRIADAMLKRREE